MNMGKYPTDETKNHKNKAESIYLNPVFRHDSFLELAPSI